MSVHANRARRRGGPDRLCLGDLPFLVHFCGGNGRELISLSDQVKEGDWVFSSHPAHYHYLLAGGSRSHLETLIRSGQSMFVFDRDRNFLTSPLLAGTCGIAAGVAWQLKEENSSNRVWCFIGDGARRSSKIIAHRVRSTLEIPVDARRDRGAARRSPHRARRSGRASTASRQRPGCRSAEPRCAPR